MDYKAIIALIESDKRQEAISLAENCINENPSSVWPKELLCYAYAYMSNKKKAMEIWKNDLIKSDKKYAQNHLDSPVSILLEQRGWIKRK